MVEACSVDPLARACAPSAIWLEPVETWLIACFTCPNMSLRSSTIFFMELPSVSDGEMVLTSTLRSPSAIRSNDWEILVMW